MESAGTTTVTGGVVSPQRIFLLGHPHPRRSRSRPRRSTAASAATRGTVPARVGGHRAGPVGGSQVVSISSARRTSKTCRTNSSCCASSCAYGTNSRTGSTSAGPAAVQPRPEPSDPKLRNAPTIQTRGGCQFPCAKKSVSSPHLRSREPVAPDGSRGENSHHRRRPSHPHARSFRSGTFDAAHRSRATRSAPDRPDPARARRPVGPRRPGGIRQGSAPPDCTGIAPVSADPGRAAAAPRRRGS